MPPAQAVADYILVPIDSLQAETVLGFDLFIQHQGMEPVLYRARDMEFGEEVRLRLAESGVSQLLVPAEQQEAFESYCRTHSEQGPDTAEVQPVVNPEEAALAEILGDAGTPIDLRCDTLLGVNHAIVETALDDLSSPGLPGRVRKVSEATAKFLLAEPLAYSSMVQRFKVSFELCSHLSNTALYVTEFARALGMDDVEEMAALGRAALLHDVGRGGLPESLLHKEGRLSDIEWAEVMAHPERGVALLTDAGWDDPLLHDICANHHERCDGSGYPRGLQRDQISLSARMVAIADTFDTLTSTLSTRPALSGFQALWRMKREMAGQFDTELLDRFVQLMVDPAMRR